jgi:hypothetical protein
MKMFTFSFLSPDGCLVNLDGNEDMYNWQLVVGGATTTDTLLSETKWLTAIPMSFAMPFCAF